MNLYKSISIRFRLSIFCSGLLVFLGISLFPEGVKAAPNVAVSIAPVHSLVSSVMRGIAEPKLLISAGQSPHANSLKPSAMRELARAELLIWIGPEFEISLRKPVSQQRKMRLVTLIDIPDMQLLSVRHSGLWQLGSEDHDHDQHGQADPHLWLSTKNAILIVRSIEKILADMDLDNAQLYHANALQLIEKIEKTKFDIEESLIAVKAVPYLVYHDAYHYFEREFGLSPAGAVTLNPGRKPGVKTLLAIKRNIKQNQVICIFHEPQFQPRLVARIAEETDILTAELDPVGAALAPGPEQWFELMFSLRDSLLKCMR